MKYDENLGKILTELDVKFRFVNVAETYEFDRQMREPVLVEQDKIKNPMQKQGVRCELFDNSTDKLFVYGCGESEDAAFADAIEKAKTTPRPPTKGQELMKQKLDDLSKEKDAEIMELKRRLDEMAAQIDAKGKRPQPTT